MPVSKLRLCLDIDNVLCDSDQVMRRLIFHHSKANVELTYDEIVTFNYYECRDSRGQAITRDEWQAIHEIFSLPENILSISPYPGVINHVSRLAEKYAIHLATSRLLSARQSTVEWLDRNGFPPHSLHFLGYGEKHLALATFDATVEDDPIQAERFAETGSTSFLLAHPWNRPSGCHAAKRMGDWNQLVQALLVL